LGHSFLIPPATLRSASLRTSAVPRDDGGDSTSSDENNDVPDDKISFEEQIKRLNSQFNIGGDGDEGGKEEAFKEEAFDYSTIPRPTASEEREESTSSSSSEPFTLSSFTSSFTQQTKDASQKGFSISGDMAASTSYWGDAKRGFTMKNLPRSKSKGTHNPGDLALTYTNLLNSGVTFMSAGEDENMSEELLGFFDSQNRLTTTAQIATSYIPKPFVIRQDRTKELNPKAKKGGFFSKFQVRFGSGSVLERCRSRAIDLGWGMWIFIRRILVVGVNQNPSIPVENPPSSQALSSANSAASATTSASKASPEWPLLKPSNSSKKPTSNWTLSKLNSASLIGLR